MLVNAVAVQISPASPLRPVTACDEIDNFPSRIPVQSAPRLPAARLKSSEAGVAAEAFCESTGMRTRRRQSTASSRTGLRAWNAESLAKALVSSPTSLRCVRALDAHQHIVNEPALDPVDAVLDSPVSPGKPWQRVVRGQPLVGGGQHVGQVLAPDLHRRRREHAQQQVGGYRAGRRGERPQPGRAQPR